MNALILGTLVVTLWVAGHASAASSRLDVIELPVGFNPEGIMLGDGWTVYVGSQNGEKLTTTCVLTVYFIANTALCSSDHLLS